MTVRQILQIPSFKNSQVLMVNLSDIVDID